jgi:hypothetical protein
MQVRYRAALRPEHVVNYGKAHTREMKEFQTR